MAGKTEEPIQIVKGKPQLVLPAAPAPSKADFAFNRLGQAYEYLSEAGWMQVGINEKGQELWSDPKASTKGEIKLAIVLPGREDQPGVPVRQMYLPPVQWDYPTDEAVKIQRERERGGDTLESLIESKKKDLQRLIEQLEKNKAAAPTKKVG